MKDFFEQAAMQDHPLRVLEEFLAREASNEQAKNVLICPARRRPAPDSDRDRLPALMTNRRTGPKKIRKM